MTGTIEVLVVGRLKERRLYIYELAKAIGIPETRLRRILKGRVTPRAEELERIAHELVLPVADLVTPERITANH